MPEVSTDAPASDDILVEMARGGDRASMEELFRRHWATAYHVAYRLLGHDQDAQDAAQESMIKTMSHLRDFHGQSGFRTWLLRIVTNAAYDIGRRRKRQPTLSLGTNPAAADGEDPAYDHDPAHALRRQDLRLRLDDALGRISRKHRETFVLFAEAGLSYEEIAQVQGVPKGTVMSRIHYARTKLQSYLEGVEGL